MTSSMQRSLLLALSLVVTTACSAPAPKTDDGKSGDKPADGKAATQVNVPFTKVRMTTNLGVIDVELDVEKAPISVQNFVQYVQDKAYDGTIFHRVIDGFMIQGGGFDTDLNKRPVRSPIANESDNGLSNARGTISMARMRSPHSATNQFFINVKDNKNLDNRPGRPGYTVFGKVIAGMDVVDKIRVVQTGSCGPFRTDCPKEQVVIQSVAELK
mgnify:CR=1 FL=1